MAGVGNGREVRYGVVHEAQSREAIGEAVVSHRVIGVDRECPVVGFGGAGEVIQAGERVAEIEGGVRVVAF